MPLDEERRNHAERQIPLIRREIEHPAHHWDIYQERNRRMDVGK